MPQEGIGLGETVEKMQIDIEMLKKQYGDLQDVLKEMVFSKYRDFETAKKYIEQKKVVSLSELRFKFPSISNTDILSKFNQIYDSSVAIFMIFCRGNPRFYVDCKSTDTLYDFARLWNRTLGIGQKDLSISDIKTICHCGDKEIKVLKEFIEVFFSNFAYFDEDKLKRK